MVHTIHEKLKQAHRLMAELDIDMWLTLARETDVQQDPVLSYIADYGLTSLTAFIITAGGDRIAIVSNIDRADVTDAGEYGEVIEYVDSITPALMQTIQRLSPQRIAINYSADMPVADGLSAGLYRFLIDLLRETPYGSRLVSSENIIAGLRGRKSPQELGYMKQAIDDTLQLFDLADGYIRAGRSERDVAADIQAEMGRRNLSPAWDLEHSPLVFTGPEAVNPHAAATDRLIEHGHLVNMDLGVRCQGFCSDLQRTWYVLEKGETSPPAAVERGFRVLRDALHRAVEALRPGRLGVDIDAIARGVITDAGFEPYRHGLGHQVGRKAHDGGAMLGPDWARYGKTTQMPIEEGQVYTVEPRLWIDQHGTVTIEEEVVIEAGGARYLSQPQEKLRLVPA